jgi:hypothetical protein
MKLIIPLCLLSLVTISIFSLDYDIPHGSYSICSGDLDNDGDNDIVIGHNYELGIISFLYNDGTGEFTLEDTLHLFGGLLVYEIVNLDENPMNDILVHYQNGYGGTQHFAVFYNNDIDNPIFYDSGISGEGMSFHDVGDLDNDGDIDLVFSFDAYLWCVFYNLGNQEFSDPVFYDHGAHVIKCEDLDGDGKADVVTQAGETNIHYSTGSGFETELLCLDVINGTMVLEDMDNDGDFDIVLSQLFQPRNYFRIYENLGNREYQLHAQDIQGSFAEAQSVDVNGDQLPDIALVISPPSFSVFYNLGNFYLSDDDHIYVGDLGEYNQKGCFDDFDENGTQDVVITRWITNEPNVLSIFYNDGEGNFSEQPVSADNDELQITDYKLSNYPNPFNPETTINFELPVIVENAKIEIYNAKGQKVDSLPISFDSAQDDSVVWDATDFASGIYFYKFNIPDSPVKKMLLLK